MAEHQTAKSAPVVKDRALIDIARETVAAVRRHELAHDAEFAAAFVLGYEAGVAAAREETRPLVGEAHTRQVQQANDRLRARIAELEAQLAAQPEAQSVDIAGRDDRAVGECRAGAVDG